MPLLTHDETGATSMAKAGGGSVAQRRAAPARTASPRAPRGPGAAPSRAAGAVRASAAPKPPKLPRTPNAGAGKKKKKERRLGRGVRRLIYGLLALAVLAPVTAFVVGWTLFDVPTADDTTITQVANFTFAGGEELAVVRPQNVNRVKVTLDKVPEHVKQAVLAAEDRTFFSNPGFDITGIGRAVYNQLTGGVGGGSTITQQYVKVSTGEKDPTLWRKYREVVLAVKISKEQQKDQILENYLNKIYFGRSAYGIQAASQAYFGKPVGELTVSEGALLAGLIQAPSRWAPTVNPDGSLQTADAERRWTFVADQMAEQQWVTPAERADMAFPDNWLHEPPALGGVPDDDRYHIYERARAELQAQGISEDLVNTEGLTVQTTIQQGRQRDAVEAVKKFVKTPKDQADPAALRAALVSIDPRTGAILAYYGGDNGLGTDYAGEGKRPPGSTFKPFVLAAALQAPGLGIGLGSTFDGTSPRVFEGISVNNNEGFDCQRCTLKTAMTKSINTVFYDLALRIGIPRVIDTAHQAGIPGDLLTEVRGGIALGDQDVHPIDMASAFGTFAAEGQRHPPYIVAKVVAADGRVLFDRTAPDSGTQTMTQQVARNVTESMLDVPSGSRIALAGGRPVAAKTGTVQKENSGNDNKDAWTVGYTPSVSTAVWVGTDTSAPIRDGGGKPIFGRTVPGPIWQTYMNSALQGTSEEQFSTFVPMGEPPAADPVLQPVVQDEDSSADDSESDSDSDSDERKNSDSDDDDRDSGRRNSDRDDSGGD